MLLSIYRHKHAYREVPRTNPLSHFSLFKEPEDEYVPVRDLLNGKHVYSVCGCHGCGCGFRCERIQANKAEQKEPIEHKITNKIDGFFTNVKYKLGLRFKWENRADEMEKSYETAMEKLLEIIEAYTTVGNKLEVFCINDDTNSYYEYERTDTIGEDMNIEVVEIDLGNANWREQLVIKESTITVCYRSI